MIPVLRTERLTLRGPRLDDFEPVAAFLGSERAAYVGGARPRHRAWTTFASLLGHWDLRGYGMWSLELRETGAFVGIVGLYDPEGWFAPEVGWWIVDPAVEGRGYAREAAIAARRYAYEVVGWREAFSVIAPENARSIALAERLGARLDRTVSTEAGGPALIYRHPSPETLRQEALR
jgi:RimJ/RimL family protein N-acetyltransferase